MEQNVGATDQLVRTVLGAGAGAISLAVLAGALSAPVVLSPVLGIISVILLVTGVTGTCGLYSALGVSTCPRDTA